MLAVIGALVATAMPIELYSSLERLPAVFFAFGAELAAGALAFVVVRRWPNASRSAATAFGVFTCLCLCRYAALVGGHATVALLVSVVLIWVAPVTLPLGPSHQMLLGSACAIGIGTMAGSTGLPIPLFHALTAIGLVTALSSIVAVSFTRSRWRTFEREAVLCTAHEQLRTALAQAQTAVDIRDRLVANVSHELRTPLNVIVGYSDMLIDEQGDVASSVARIVPKIRSSAIALDLLVKDLLDLSRLSCGKVKLNLTDIDVPALLEEVARGTRVLLGEKPVEVEIDCKIDRHLSDRLRLYQILNNLATNAAKFTTEGKIVLSARAHHNRIAFYVSDTGCGIPAARQETIFAAFEQVDPNASDSRGIGLGLALVRQLTDVLGGDVSVTSAPGVGSSFAVMLPMALPQVSRAARRNAVSPTPRRLITARLRLLQGGAQDTPLRIAGLTASSK